MSIGAALAPLMAGLIAVRSSLQNAILTISVTAWLPGSVFLALAAYLAPHDIKILRSQMRLRAESERAILRPEPAR